MVQALSQAEQHALRRLVSEPGWRVVVQLIQHRARSLEYMMAPDIQPDTRTDAWGQRRALLSLVHDIYQVAGVSNPYSEGVVPLWQHTETPQAAGETPEEQSLPARPVRHGGGLVG